MGRVYCINCKWYKDNLYTSGHDYCCHPENIHTYREVVKGDAEYPKEINKKNDCKWYEALARRE